MKKNLVMAGWYLGFRIAMWIILYFLFYLTKLIFGHLSDSILFIVIAITAFPSVILALYITSVRL